ncbi:MAG: insulinase family protein [Treponema sp.]|nr:insulinase family protein [Treponema sp.]
MNIVKKIGVLLVLAASFCACQRASVPQVSEYTLANGLTLFVAENHAVPLVFVEIAVRAGAVTQTPETAGLFHLYEHMMFKGNELYPDAAAVQRALSDMGVADWNGTTGVDRVNYFFTIPAEQLEAGLAFWNAAIRTPLMRDDELENEKRVVIAEIEGSQAQPGQVYRSYLNAQLFPDAPYRTDPAGSVQVVSQATVAHMRAIQAAYYVPENAALFVGGDVNPADVCALVERIYGTWSSGNTAAVPPLVQQTMTPLQTPRFAVMPYDQLPPNRAQVAVLFRGPDADFALDDTYAADYLVQLCAEPDGSFKQRLVHDEVLAIPDVEYVDGGYQTQRATGVMQFSATLLSPETDLLARISHFRSQVQEVLLPELASDTALYTKDRRTRMTRYLRDEDIRARQSVAGVLSTVRFWWACTSADYYYTYRAKLSRVRQAAVERFVATYITSAPPLVTVLVHPDVYATLQDEFTAAGYETITRDNAFWWNDTRFAPTLPAPDRAVSVQDAAPIYRPTAPHVAPRVDAAARANRGMTRHLLSNGIPVYIEHAAPDGVSAISLAVKGGISHLTVETSGLEQALFTLMSRSSTAYDYDTRQRVLHDTHSSIDVQSRIGFSALSLTVIDDYLYDVLPLFVDGFLHPAYAADVYATMMTGYEQDVQSLLNNPQRLLDYTVTQTLYADHPYAVRTSVLPDSVHSITVDALRSLHERIVRPENIIVVASGAFAEQRFIRALDVSLGALERDGAAARSDSHETVPLLTVTGAPVILSHPSARGTGFAERVFAGPARTSSDYVPAVIAADIYADILFTVVREHYGVCYTPTAYVGSSDAPLGGEYLYRLSDVTRFAAAVAEARTRMAAGQVIESIAEDGTYISVALSDRLDGYKNSYINKLYAARSTVAERTGISVFNLITYGDARYDEWQAAAVPALTAEDILRVFRTYWIEGESRWFVLVGPEAEAAVRF